MLRCCPYQEASRLTAYAFNCRRAFPQTARETRLASLEGKPPPKHDKKKVRPLRRVSELPLP
jgi:hypothetical protein